MEKEAIKLACRDDLLPAGSMREKSILARQLGFKAIELHGNNVWHREKEILTAYKEGFVFSDIAAGYRGSLFGSHPSEHLKAYKTACSLLRFAAEIGADGLVIVPFLGLPFSSLNSLVNLSFHQDKLVENLQGLAELAEELKVNIFIEAVNRYESPCYNRLEEIARLISRIGRSNSKILADLFHMNIEERSIQEALCRYGDRVGLVHLADSNRLPPGEGHIDFRKVMKSLMRTGFTGYLSFECRGKIDAPMLKKAVEHIKKIYEDL